MDNRRTDSGTHHNDCSIRDHNNQINDDQDDKMQTQTPPMPTPSPSLSPSPTPSPSLSPSPSPIPTPLLSPGPPSTPPPPAYSALPYRDDDAYDFVPRLNGRAGDVEMVSADGKRFLVHRSVLEAETVFFHIYYGFVPLWRLQAGDPGAGAPPHPAFPSLPLPPHASSHASQVPTASRATSNASGSGGGNGNGSGSGGGLNSLLCLPKFLTAFRGTTSPPPPVSSSPSAETDRQHECVGPPVPPKPRAPIHRPVSAPTPTTSPYTWAVPESSPVLVALLHLLYPRNATFTSTAELRRAARTGNTTSSDGQSPHSSGARSVGRTEMEVELQLDVDTDVDVEMEIEAVGSPDGGGEGEGDSASCTYHSLSPEDALPTLELTSRVIRAAMGYQASRSLNVARARLVDFVRLGSGLGVYALASFFKFHDLAVLASAAPSTLAIPPAEWPADVRALMGRAGAARLAALHQDRMAALAQILTAPIEVDDHSPLCACSARVREAWERRCADVAGRLRADSGLEELLEMDLHAAGGGGGGGGGGGVAQCHACLALLGRTVQRSLLRAKDVPKSI